MSDDTTPSFPEPLGTGSRTQHVYQGPRGQIRYTAVADWVTLREHDEPVASLFYTAYLADRPDGSDPGGRPITFVFNGGPGSASVWLHIGMVGPRRLAFAENGSLLPPPAKLIDNPESWLDFTDIVCLDPVGTGFSRTHEHGPKPPDAKPAEKAPEPSRFWEVERDLHSVSEAIARILSQEGRWLSPVALAGESYGGFRVARLARTLQEDHGVSLNAAILISPGIELSTLVPHDYGIEHFIELFPSFAATAHAQGRAGQGVSEAEHRRDAEDFASGDLATMLVRGSHIPDAQAIRLCGRASELTGIGADLWLRAGGRISRDDFCRELLRDQGRFVGRYDGTVSSVDPYPARAAYEGPDLTLGGIAGAFTAGIHHLLFEELGVKTELTYQTLNMTANLAWKDKGMDHFVDVTGRSMDALRYGMALNPHMKVLISHGYHDLVTPYTGCDRLVRLLSLHADQREQLLTEHYHGGHMFYTHPDSRDAFTARVRRLLER